MKEKFLGVWNLLEMKSISERKNVEIYPLGKVEGQLIYTENRMSAQLGSKKRKNFKNNDYRKGLQEEIEIAFNSFISYYGEYEIIPDKNLIIHKVKQSLFPNWVGQNVKRYYKFEDENLILQSTPIRYKKELLTPTLVWHKIK